MKWAVMAVKHGFGISSMASSESSSGTLSEAIGRIGLNMDSESLLLINVNGQEIMMRPATNYIVDDEVYCFRGAIKSICESLRDGPVRICEAPENFMVLGE